MNSTVNRVICIVVAQLVFATLAQSVSAQETAKGLLAISGPSPRLSLRQAD